LSLFDFKKNVIKEQGKYFFISNDDSTEIFFVDENSIEIRDAKLIKPELDSMKFAFIKKEPTEYAVELITVFLDPQKMRERVTIYYHKKSSYYLIKRVTIEKATDDRNEYKFIEIVDFKNYKLK